MEITVKKDYADMSKACAVFIAGYINSNPGKLLCLAAGDTPLGVLNELVNMHTEGSVDLTSMFYVSLDEWVGLDNSNKGSCGQVMEDSIYVPANIPKNRLALFDGKGDIQAETKRILDFVESHGGIGLTLLGVGINGHVGFNEPGTAQDFAGGLVKLSKTSVEVGQKYFDTPQPLEYGVTVGLKYLTSAEKVLIIANGNKKSEIIASSLSSTNNQELPVSFFNGDNVHFFLDEEAAGGLFINSIK